jgi:hypothetical protein
MCLTKHRAMKTYWGVEVQLLAFLTSKLDEDEWSASRTGRFTPRERVPDTHWIGDWMGPRAVLYAVVKRKTYSPHRESNPRTPIAQPVAQGCTDWAITALTRISVLYDNRLDKQGEKVWTGFFWLKTRTRDGLLWTRQWIFEFRKRRSGEGGGRENCLTSGVPISF